MSSMNMNICDSHAVGKPRACIRSNMVALPESEPVVAWTQRPQGGRPNRPNCGSGTLFGQSPTHPTPTSSSTTQTIHPPPARSSAAQRPALRPSTTPSDGCSRIGGILVHGAIFLLQSVLILGFDHMTLAHNSILSCSQPVGTAVPSIAVPPAPRINPNYQKN